MAKLSYRITDGSYVTLEGSSMNHLRGIRDRDPARVDMGSVQVPLRNVEQEHLDMPVMNFGEDEDDESGVQNDAGDHLALPKMF